MNVNVTQLIFTESGGFTGLQRSCTIQPDALPEASRGQLQSLLQQPEQTAAQASGVAMPDMQLYTLELLLQAQDMAATSAVPTAKQAHAAGAETQHWVRRYPADDVPDDVADLIEFLRERAQPL